MYVQTKISIPMKINISTVEFVSTPTRTTCGEMRRKITKTVTHIKAKTSDCFKINLAINDTILVPF